jgi:tRNA dimethylallyltransferase
MEPTNRRRIIRALEVTEGSGRPFSQFGAGLAAYAPTPRFALTGIELCRDVVAERVERRVGEMMAAGFLDEVEGLEARPGGLGVTARQALGYRELLAHLEQGLPLAAMVEATVTRTRAFSARQRRWFRRDPRIRWFATERNPVALLPALLRELQRCHL